MKHLHRLIVTSNAYRRVSSVGSAEGAKTEGASGSLGDGETDLLGQSVALSTSLLARDPENKRFWRMNPGRMEAEVVRDSLLFVAGRLDLTMGGQELENSEALKTFRRTLYYSCNPETDGKSEFGALFDAPEPADCYRRTRSVIPQQALALTNSDLVHELSLLIVRSAGEIGGGGEGEKEDLLFVSECFERILCRSPSASELSVCLEALQTQKDALSKSGLADAVLRSRASLVRALLNHNDFVTIR